MAPARPPRVLYHISPGVNTASIQEEGVSPDYANTEAKTPRIYAVEHNGIAWAIAHCSARHGIPVSGLMCFQILHTGEFRHFNRVMWYCTAAVPVNQCLDAPTWLETHIPDSDTT